MKMEITFDPDLLADRDIPTPGDHYATPEAYICAALHFLASRDEIRDTLDEELEEFLAEADDGQPLIEITDVDAFVESLSKED